MGAGQGATGEGFRKNKKAAEWVLEGSILPLYKMIYIGVIYQKTKKKEEETMQITD